MKTCTKNQPEYVCCIDDDKTLKPLRVFFNSAVFGVVDFAFDFAFDEDDVTDPPTLLPPLTVVDSDGGGGGDDDDIASVVCRSFCSGVTLFSLFTYRWMDGWMDGSSIHKNPFPPHSTLTQSVNR
mmetsp:Transcript_25988/g.61677  ORF Transcript_25988/g.61677 Transcript_25988/m.61677 type:complete len:125 (-) Transcript_25988:83-457(-)